MAKKQQQTKNYKYIVDCSRTLFVYYFICVYEKQTKQQQQQQKYQTHSNDLWTFSSKIMPFPILLTNIVAFLVCECA